MYKDLADKKNAFLKSKDIWITEKRGMKKREGLSDARGLGVVEPDHGRPVGEFIPA